MATRTKAKAKAKPKSKNPASKRDYSMSGEGKYDKRPDVAAKRAKRMRDRRKAEKEGRVKKGDGKHVDHIEPLRKNANSKKTRIVSASKNTAWRKGKKGYD